MHSSPRRKYPLSAALAVAMAFALPHLAHAFAEDVCYLPDGGGIDNCVPLPPSCEPAGTVSAQCRADALRVVRAQGNTFVGGRSTIHADVSHLLAQAVGFSADSAYWIAAYNEATDLGTFTPYDMNGLPVPGGWTTATLDGLERTNFADGGVLFHFHAPRNGGWDRPSPTIDGLEPDVHDADSEVFLANLRSWALDASSVPQCTAGLTAPTEAGDYATGSDCFALSDGMPGSVVGAIAAVGGTAVNFSLPTGLQVVVTSDTTGGDPLTSDSFDAIVGSEHALDARLGVYLHALGDRVSHHVCTDASVLTGPDADGEFTEYMDNSDCVQTLHAVRHAWETGVDYSLLDEADRTTEAALDAVYDELLVFAQARGTLRSEASRAAYREELLAAVTGVLQNEDAAARIGSLAGIACAHGFEPFPGAPACPVR